MRTRFLPVWFLAVALMGVGLWQGNHDAARAATYYVTNNNDSGAGSLRAAIASATSGSDEVHVATAGPIQLSSGPITISNNLTIKGPDIAVDPTADPLTQFPALTGQVAIQSDGNGSVFFVASGNVIMSHLYITGGVAAGTTFPAGTGDPAYGGGVNNAGTLTLNYCTIEGNSAVAGNGATAGGIAYGGGIYSTGTLTLNQSTVRNNNAYGGAGANGAGTANSAFGGGIFSTGTATINNSTLSGNSAIGGGVLAGAYATTYGGTVGGGGLAQAAGTLKLTNTTISGNQAVGGLGNTQAGSAGGGGVGTIGASFAAPPLNVTISGNSVSGFSTNGSGFSYNGGSALTINNSIVANNTGATNDLDASPGYNANGSPAINTSVSLNALGDNGGPTETITSSDGEVVNAGDNSLSSSLSTDQRGAPRVYNGAVDAGAVENGSAVPSNTPPDITQFNVTLLNGDYSFSASNFINALSYPDVGDSLKAIVLTSVPPSAVGYFTLNGQILTVGSVILVGDLNNLQFHSIDPNNNQFNFTWQPSNGVNDLPAPSPVQSQGSYSSPLPITSGGGPSLSVNRNGLWDVVYASPGYQTGTFYVSASSSVTSLSTPFTATSVTVGALGQQTSDSHASGGSSVGSFAITVPLTSGMHYITVRAYDIRSQQSTYSFEFLVDQIPQFANKPDFLTGNPFNLNLGDTFSQEIKATDPDYYVPTLFDYKPEPLHFQVDQVCYGENSACDNTKTATNVGTFSSTSLTGNLNNGTTLDTIFNWKPTKAGIYGLKVTLTDYWASYGTSGAQDFVFTVIVNQPANQPPVITNPGAQTAVKGTAFSLPVVVTDAESDPLTYTISGLPPGLTMTPTGSGVTISGTPTTVGNYAVTLTANDGNHTTPTSATFNINVKDVGSPVIDNIKVGGNPLSSPVNVGAGQPFTSMQATAHINNYPDTLTFITYEGGNPANTVGTWSNTNTVGTPGSPGLVTVTSAFNWPSVPAGIHVVTVRVTAGNGQYDERQFTIQAGNAPSLTLTPNGTISATVGQLTSISADAVDADANETLTFSLSGQPAGVAFLGQTVFTNVPSNTHETATVQWTPTVAEVGSYTFNVIVTDSAGLQAIVPITVNVDPAPPNSPPTVQNPGSQSVNVGSAANIQIVANDPDSDPLTYSSANLPTWASINPSNGLITGTPGVGDIGSTNVTVSVKDTLNPAVSVTFQLNVVQSANGAPVVSNPGTWIASVGTSSAISIFATDPESDPLTYTPSANMPSWVTLTPGPAGVILSGTPGSGDVGTTSVTVNVSDGVNTVPVTFEIKVVASGVPTLQASPNAPANPEQLQLGNGYYKIFVATDSDYPDTLTFTPMVTRIDAGPAGNTGDATFVPMYESGSSSTGTTRAEAFEWTPDTAGTYKVEISVTDAQSHVTSLTFTIHVSSPPTIQITPSTFNATPELPLSIPVNVSDGDSNETLVLSLGSGAPSGMSFNGSGTFVNVPANTIKTANLTWTPSIFDAFATYTFDVTVTDSGGLTATKSVTINVSDVNERPVIQDPGTITVIQTHEVSIPISAYDPEGDPLTYSVSSSPSGLGLSIDSNGVINGTVAGAPGTYQETVEVDDGHHVSPASSLTFTIIVKDSSQNSPPVWLFVPDQTVSVGQHVSINLGAYVSDPDHDIVTFTEVGGGLNGSGLALDSNTGILSGTPTNFAVGTYHVTITADDAYHGSAPVSFVLTVLPNQPPFSTTLSDYNLYEGNYLYVDASTNDPEGDAITYTATGLPGWATINSSTGIISGIADNHYGSFSVVVTATDTGSGSSTSYPPFTINVLSPFTVGFSNSGGGYATITYSLINNTNATINPTITGSLTGLGYTDNANAFFNANQGFVDDQWASPVIQRKLDPTKNTRIITWTVGDLAPGDTATLTISVPIKGSTPTNQQLTNQWTAQYGTSNGPVSLNVDPVTQLTPPVPGP